MKLLEFAIGIWYHKYAVTIEINKIQNGATGAGCGISEESRESSYDQGQERRKKGKQHIGEEGKEKEREHLPHISMFAMSAGIFSICV